jgi:hypothetical protein
MKKSAFAVFAVAAAVGVGGAASAFAAGPGTGVAKPGWQSRAIARIQAAEKSGRLGTAKGEALIARVRSGRHVRLGRGGFVRAAAGFVGQTPQQFEANLPGLSKPIRIMTRHDAEVFICRWTISPIYSREHGRF